MQMFNQASDFVPIVCNLQYVHLCNEFFYWYIRICKLLASYFLKWIFVYLDIKLSHSVNGSDVWGSSAPYGDVLPVFKWNIYKKNK